jgi:hypothetical protein
MDRKRLEKIVKEEVASLLEASDPYRRYDPEINPQTGRRRGTYFDIDPVEAGTDRRGQKPLPGEAQPYPGFRFNWTGTSFSDRVLESLSDIDFKVRGGLERRDSVRQAVDDAATGRAIATLTWTLEFGRTAMDTKFKAEIRPMGGSPVSAMGDSPADAMIAAGEIWAAESGPLMGGEGLSESRWSQLAGLMVEGGGRYSTQKRPTGAMKTRSIFVEPGDMGRIRNLVKAAASQSKSPLSITAVEGDDDEGFQVQLSGGVMAHNAFKTLEMGPSPQGGEPLTFATEPGAGDLDLSDVLYEDDKTEDEDPVDEGDGDKKPKPYSGEARGSAAGEAATLKRPRSPRGRARL